MANIARMALGIHNLMLTSIQINFYYELSVKEVLIGFLLKLKTQKRAMIYPKLLQKLSFHLLVGHTII